MDAFLSFVILGGLFGISVYFIFFILKKFKTKTSPQQTSAMPDNIEEIESLGLRHEGEKYAGYYKDYYISIFASKDTKYGEGFQVVAAIAPEKDELNNLEGFRNLYFVIEGEAGFAYAGFLINSKTEDNSEGTLQSRLDALLDTLRKAGIKPYLI